MVSRVDPQEQTEKARDSFSMKRRINEFQSPAPSNGHLGAIGGVLLDRHLIRGSLWSGFFPPCALHIQEFLIQCCSACTSDVNHSVLKNITERFKPRHTFKKKIRPE